MLNVREIALDYTPITTDEVFAGLSAQTVLELERDHGNTDLIRAVEYARLAGPFSVVSPWELEDPEGVRRINASGYAASPFGDRYPLLLDFLRRYLGESRAMGLPQQSASAWRAALEANLVRLVAQLAPSHRDSRVFFSNSGAEAMEAAIKLAKAYRPEATYFVNFKRAFHGKTSGACTARPIRTPSAAIRCRWRWRSNPSSSYATKAWWSARGAWARWAWSGSRASPRGIRN